MRTLLIDNFDSYTYNLFQLVAEVNGVEPAVITNDTSLEELGRLDVYDNVIISPGPGRPDVDRDFGISAQVIAQAEAPVLGVCLGHQGIGAHEGARVQPAPKPRHGFLSSVRHDGTGLFRNIQSTFLAVRYHSLALADPLPAALRAVAWAEDDVIMAVEHRTRPLWGVQFHPESVATEHGRQLLANFRALTEQLARPGRSAGGRGAALPAGRAMVLPRRREDDGRAQPGPVPALRTGRLHRLNVRTLPGAADAPAAFRELYGESPDAFWLDSSYRPEGLARFSFLGDASGPLGEVVSYQVGDPHVSVCSRGEVSLVPGTIFDYLEEALAKRQIEGPDLPFDLRCGYVGYFGYELKADLGATNAHRSAAPDAAWMFVDRMIAIDHEEKTTYLLALEADGASDWIESTAARLALLSDSEEVRPTSAAGTSNPPPLDQALVNGYLSRDRARYLADIDHCQAKLVAGESYEICLTNMVHLPAVDDGLVAYLALRRWNPAPYGAYFRLAGVEVASSSPERFLRIDRNRWVESKPIKGTAPRGKDAAQDIQLCHELRTSPKTRAENLMIVDLLRNDLGRVCEIGSVHVPRLMATETYATVHQLVSTVRGRLRTDRSVIDCVRACFPGGSMTGAPKLRTMEIIDTLETDARGIYSGALGFLGCDGTADLSIVIRTAVLVDDVWHVGSGGAIVLDSDPGEELDEMLLKAATTVRAVASPATGRAVSGQRAFSGAPR
ncbi:aminodeoxychorismate synthase component I [Parafrankia sp. EUN1f]|uniref:aminodeoxychorismate synthase component I n=1 Tax=Parafrankia sp. EUN1f TaxID=102897 RepID=UPI0001C44634|nr:aminodeoxychorismate synthase component I [Parafrankia sp. EUN1f]EFC85489.1 para-aminobenzoate synthase, subunit I [Parafrankia sp. EUN1f]